MSWKLPVSISTCCLVVTLLTGCGNPPQSTGLVKPLFEAEKTLTQQKLISDSGLVFDPKQNLFKLQLAVQSGTTKMDAERLVSRLLSDVASSRQAQSPSMLLKPYNISIDIVSGTMKGSLLYHASKADGSSEIQWF